jgi:hypothetical protein
VAGSTSHNWCCFQFEKMGSHLPQRAFSNVHSI